MTDIKSMTIDELKELLYKKVKQIHVERYPYNDFLFEKYDNEEFEE